MLLANVHTSASDLHVTAVQIGMRLSLIDCGSGHLHIQSGSRMSPFSNALQTSG
jgi:hypothetical protein